MLAGISSVVDYFRKQSQENTHADWLKSCFYNSMETELAQAVDVVIALTKIIYILIIRVNKLFSKRNRKRTPCFYGVIETRVKVWENSKKLWKHSPAAPVPTAFLVLPNFHSCFYNSIETWYIFSIS